MNRDKKLLLVLVCLLCIVATLCLLLSIGISKEAVTETEGQTLSIVKERKTEDISSFTIRGQDKDITLSRGEDGWVYNSDSSFPLSDDFVNTALTTLSMIDAVRVVEGGVAEAASYGLAEAQMSLTVTDSQGSEEYLIGDYNSFNGYHYMCVAGGEDVYMIDTDLVDLCTSEEADMIVLDSLPDTYADGSITGVTLTGPEGETVLDGQSEDFETLAQELATLSLTDYEDYCLSDEEYSRYGFDSAVTVHIDYSGEKTTTKEDGSQVSATVAYEYEIKAVAYGEEYVCFLIEDSDILYRMASNKLPTLYELL